MLLDIKQVDAVKYSGEVFSNIFQNIEFVNRGVISISTAVEEQSAATQEIVQSINTISNMPEDAKTASTPFIEDTGHQSERLHHISNSFSKMKLSRKAS